MTPLVHLLVFPLTALALSCMVPACNRAKSHETAAGTSLPELAKVPEFSLTNQHAEPFGSAQLKGRRYLAAFMFTRCPSVCPRLTATMKQIQARMKDEQLQLDLVSISVDPAYDTPAILSQYARRHGADEAHWNFLTGDYAVIARTAEDGFKVGLSGNVDQSKPHLGITHASHLILVDETGSIRGYFKSSDEGVSQQVFEAVQRLTSEASGGA